MKIKLLSSCAIGMAMLFNANVQAACSGTPVTTQTAINTLLNGNTVCVASGSGWEAQEEHRSGGQLWDYKLGPAAPGNVDPEKQVGTWNIFETSAGSGVYKVRYDYGPGSVFDNDVYQSGSNICFDNGTTITNATLKIGIGACP